MQSKLEIHNTTHSKTPYPPSSKIHTGSRTRPRVIQRNKLNPTLTNTEIIQAAHIHHNLITWSRSRAGKPVGVERCAEPDECCYPVSKYPFLLFKSSVWIRAKDGRGNIQGPTLKNWLWPGIGVVILVPCPKCRKFVTSAPGVNVFGVGKETDVR